jgi:hypothetical protein
VGLAQPAAAFSSDFGAWLVKPIDFYTLSRTQENDVLENFECSPQKLRAEVAYCKKQNACENMQKRIWGKNSVA